MRYVCLDKNMDLMPHWNSLIPEDELLDAIFLQSDYVSGVVGFKKT